MNTRLRALAAFVLLFACRAAGLHAQAVPADPPAALSPGDAVRITVWRSPELSGEFDIGADGSIMHPLFRDVTAAGVPFRELESRIRVKLERYSTDPQFVVAPLFRVSVGGEVRSPMLLTLGPEVTITQAIARAGGATEQGRLRAVRLIRGGVERPLDLTRPEGGAMTMTVRSGDQIVVPRRTSIFREYIAPGGSVVAAAGVLLNILLKK
ncbi:MAG: polysaccharide export protein [Gemmatimonadetes bacterium]|nr:polysaccharide export protein [Gemmatimonadota bacterium]